MAHFRTEIAAVPAPFRLSHQSVLMTIGSCFADNMGEKLAYYGFNVLRNPFGIVYNPQSIAQQLAFLLDADFEFSASDIFLHNGLYHSFWHHSAFDDSEKTAFLHKINTALHAARLHLAQSDTLFITLGTAQIHETMTEKGNIVAAN